MPSQMVKTRMIRLTAGRILAFAGLLSLAAAPSLAQNAPMQLTPGGAPPATTPAPRPPQRPANPPTSAAPNAPVPPAWSAPAQGAASRPAAPPPPAAQAPAQVQSAAVAGLDPAQVATLRRINEAYNGMREMHGRFTQIEANGHRTTGRFFITKPGKIRFVYDRPSRLDIIADGTDVVVRDRGLNTQDLYPLSQTPLRYLLNDRIDLLRDAKVVNVFNDQDMVAITIEERTQFTEGRLMLQFDTANFALRQWTITDARGNETSVAIEDVTVNQRNNPALFTIDRTPQVGPRSDR